MHGMLCAACKADENQVAIDGASELNYSHADCTCNKAAQINLEIPNQDPLAISDQRIRLSENKLLWMKPHAVSARWTDKSWLTNLIDRITIC